MHIVFKPQQGTGHATICIDRDSMHIELVTDLPPEEVGPWIEPVLKTMKIGLPVYHLVREQDVEKWEKAGWIRSNAVVMTRRV